MAICIYCSQNKTLTREHIMPAFVYAYQDSISNSKSIGWREKAQKVLQGEAVIKDVCDHCNNVVLGTLDAHAKSALEKAGAFTPNFNKSTVDFEYDFNQYARWLLKVAFNSSRASGKHLGVFDQYKDLILDKNKNYSSFIITGGLLKPYKLTKQQKIDHGQSLFADSSGYVNPFFSRVSWAQNLPNDISVKQIVIGALVFHVVSFSPNMSRVRKRELQKEYLKMCKGMAILNKGSSRTKLSQLPLTFVDSMGPHMLREEVKPHMYKLLTSC
ncbi:hypothetical protein J7X11_004706 [Vibrio parahaemolyticus]|uniref:hypothetical protein n=2 Tax=Vibrio parahaemolyticus TaxID=670 RepID=UPI0009F06FBA|nr:hypothetical protein [Vibrio parahaemolyticus]EHK2856209.1 hypothetical protein [Vibrio parahaemolyticus]OQU48684.1 hypothetical protein EM74_018750 [Vibrio parahaemolyticus]